MIPMGGANPPFWAALFGTADLVFPPATPYHIGLPLSTYNRKAKNERKYRNKDDDSNFRQLPFWDMLSYSSKDVGRFT